MVLIFYHSDLINPLCIYLIPRVFKFVAQMWVQMWCASKINFMFESILRPLLWEYLTTVLSSGVASLVLWQDTATSWAPPLGRFLSFWNGQVRLFILPLQKYFKKSFKNQTVENLIFYQNSFWLHQIHLLCSVQTFSVGSAANKRPPHPSLCVCVSLLTLRGSWWSTSAVSSPASAKWP